MLRRVADAVRRERRLPRALAVEAGVTDGDAAAHTIEVAIGEPWIDRHDPQRTLELRQSLAAVETCLARLPADSARIVRLREVEGLSNDETARALGLPPARVALVLHRARARLRDCVNRY